MMSVTAMSIAGESNLAEGTDVMSTWRRVLEIAEPHAHFAQFYGSDERSLIRNAGLYMREGLKRGESAFVIATGEHAEAFVGELKASGAEVESSLRDGKLVVLDAHAMLAGMMVDDRLNPELFENTIGSVLRDTRMRADCTGLRAYGEMVGILWKSGRFAAAIQMESFWNKLLDALEFNLFCAYPIDVLDKDFHGPWIHGLLCDHTHLLPSTVDGDLEGTIACALDDVLGFRAEPLKQLLKANYRPSWAMMPAGEAIVFWLRNNLPDDADKILDRARTINRTAPL
jgi:hypothetical protein